MVERSGIVKSAENSDNDGDMFGSTVQMSPMATTRARTNATPKPVSDRHRRLLQERWRGRRRRMPGRSIVCSRAHR